MKPPTHDLSRTVLASAIIAAVIAAGCDRKAKPIAPPALMALSGSPAETPAPTSVALRTVGTLAAGRPTTLAPMPGGSIFAVQAGPGGGSVVELAAHENDPRPTGLNVDAVLKSLGIAKVAHETSEGGHFTAIAPCADGRLAFAFAGVAGARPFAALGTYAPATKQLFVSVDFITLAAVDADLASDVARPSLFTAGDNAWLWRPAGDEVRLLSIEGLSKPSPKLTTRRVSLDQLKDVVARSAWEWSATPTAGEFLLTDTASRWIRRIRADGTISHIARFDDTFTTISPAALDAAGRIIVMGNDRDGVATCALVQNGEAFKAIDRARFDTGALGVAALRVDRLYTIPGEHNEFVAYEATSGRVLHVTLK